jgi:hypothetical protein
MTESIYPEDLLQAVACPVNEHARRWFVLYTKSRQEQALARELLRLRIPYYLPLVSKLSRQLRKRLQSPLFDGYVFLFGNEDERVRCLKTDRVVRVLPVFDQEALYGDLRRLEEVIKTGMPLAVCTSNPRNRVRVRSGSSSAVEGTGLCRRNGARIVASVDFGSGRFEVEGLGLGSTPEKGPTDASLSTGPRPTADEKPYAECKP